MSKKILFTSILSLFVLLIVGYFVVGDIGTIGIATKTTTTGSNSTVFKDNNNMVLNISISRSTGGDTLSNVTAFNVTLANDMTFIGYVSSCSSPGFAETIVNYSGSLNLGTIANTTCWSDGNAAGWSCYNRTATEIHCNTTHPGAALSAAGGHNSSIILRINVTTADLSTETQFTGFNITILDDGNIANFSLLNITRIDGQAPRITELNITDGNFTVFNGTDGNMNYGSFNLNPLNASNGIIVSSTAPLTITANIEDLLTEIGSLRLYYNTNVSKNPGNATVPHAENHTKYLTATKLSASSGNNSILYSWTIPADDLHDGAVMSFIIATNDTTNHQANLTGPGTVLTPFNLTINNTIPRILKWNITDGTNWVSNADGYLLDGTTYTMYIDVSGLNNSDTSKMYNQSVRIYYTNTTTGKVVWNETINANNALGHGLRELNFSNFSTFTPYGTNTWNAAIAASDIQLSNGNNMGFVIVVQENPLHYNYTTYAAGPGKDGFNITLDSTAPIGITLTTTDADSIVETSGSITYTCAATDALSGVNSYKFILDKPGQASAVTNAYSTTASATYTGSQTNAAGTYTLHCYVK
ncbi:MAG: hypothetical protein KKG60_01910, partial [Nanoarchaeota archaeon]|nr:hypothetical protein [Nanoarchaeota archaeon]